MVIGFLLRGETLSRPRRTQTEHHPFQESARPMSDMRHVDSPEVE
jgi:hypothetical protein